MDLLQLFAFILPAYAANMAPVVSRGKTTIDAGVRFPDGRPLFGSGKTFKGLVAGVVAGTFLGFALANLFPSAYLPMLGFKEKIVAGFLLSLGTMLGDMLGSFIKRRLNIQRGAQHEFFDQLLFLGGALALASPYYLPEPLDMVVLVVATYLLHKAANVFAHRAGIKNVPW